MDRLYRSNDIEKNLIIAGFRPLDILIVGGTGAGKSSTINALFEREVVKVGRTCDPETKRISSNGLNKYMRFWDSPGLGDNVINDERYSKALREMLCKDCYVEGKRYGLIDTVLLILDGSVRDTGTANRILNEVIVPNFRKERILVAINQADLALKGRHWNNEMNCPDRELISFLEEKADSIQNRLKKSSGAKVKRPVYYSAEKGYNVEKLLDMIIDNMPKEGRRVF